MKKIIKKIDKYNTLIFIVAVIIIVIGLVVFRKNDCICELTDTKIVEYLITYKSDTLEKTYNVELVNNKYTITSEDESYYIQYTDVYSCINNICTLYNKNIIDGVNNKYFILDYVLENNELVDYTLTIDNDNYTLTYETNVYEIK